MGDGQVDAAVAQVGDAGAPRGPEKNRVAPRKLLLSKWTAVAPQHGEKHFLVSRVSEDGAAVELTAVLTNRTQWLRWRALKDGAVWRVGWR
jgi:tryptophan-rich hypothetical protein